MRRKAPRVAVAFRRPAGAGLYLHAGRHAPGRLFSSSGGCMAARLRCGPGQNVCAAARPCSQSGGAACCAWYPPSWFKNECCRTAARLPDHRGGRGLPARRTVPDDRMLPCKGPLRQAGKGISRAKGCRPANAPAARGPACSAGIGRGRRLPPPAHLPEVRRVCAQGAVWPRPLRAVGCQMVWLTPAFQRRPPRCFQTHTRPPLPLSRTGHPRTPSAAAL